MTNFTEPEAAIRYARDRWEAGEARLLRRAGSDSRRRDVLEEVVDAIQRELERRVGQVFGTLELAHMQDDAEQWALAIAHEVAPESPWAWELDVVLDTAFHRYARRAHDFQLATDQGEV